MHKFKKKKILNLKHVNYALLTSLTMVMGKNNKIKKKSKIKKTQRY